ATMWRGPAILLELLFGRAHRDDERHRAVLVVEVLIRRARGVDVRRERAVGREEVRPRDVLAVRRVLLADVRVLVLVDADHHEVLAQADDALVEEDAVEVLTVRAPLGVEDQADRLLVLLRLGEAVVVRYPLHLLVVPVLGFDVRGTDECRRDGEQRDGDGDRRYEPRRHSSPPRSAVSYQKPRTRRHNGAA